MKVLATVTAIIAGPKTTTGTPEKLETHASSRRDFHSSREGSNSSVSIAIV
jgi:hypothetical protein